MGAAASEALVSGTVVDEAGAVVAGAHVVLAGPVAAGQLVVRSDSDGRFNIPAVPPGSYKLEVLHDGFFPTRQDLKVAGENILLELAIARQTLKQTVDVVSSIYQVDPQETSRTRTLTEEQIDRIPIFPAYDFHKALTTVPGVATDNFGRLHINGGASDQIMFLLDGFNISSPVTGGMENNFSIESVRAADVRSSRYSAEYGKGSSGVVAITTKTGDDRFRYRFTDFIPSFDNEGGIYLKDWAPRITLSGPIVKNRVWFMNAFDAKYDLDVISGLPKGGDQTNTWRWNDLMRVQAQLGPSHLLNVSYLLNDSNFRRIGLDLLNPVETTRDIHFRNHFISIKDQGYWKGILAEVGVAINRLHLRKDPQGDEMYVIEPDGRRGNYFMRSRREAERRQFMLNLAPSPRYWGGRHDLKFGVNVDRILYRSAAVRRPYLTNRQGGLPWRYTQFSGTPDYRRNNVEWSSYIQDRWAPVNRFLVEFGVRHDWDQVVEQQLFSPRLAITAVPFAGTKFSAGMGIFYDATNLFAVTRSLDQRQFDTFYHGDGEVSWGPAETVYQADFESLRAPRVANWSAGWEQKLPQRLTLRTTFLQKRGSKGFTFSSLLPAQTDTLFAVYELQNTRRDKYDAAEFTVSQAVSEDARWMASYTRSSARSNAVLDYTIENPFMSGQGAGPLDWDMPSRFISSGWFPLYAKVDFAWFMEWRDGTPFSIINGAQGLVGAPNRMRLPTYFTLNPSVEREFDLGKYRWSFRIGVNNVTARGNYALVNNNIESTAFLNYGGAQRRSLNFRIRYMGRK